MTNCKVLKVIYTDKTISERLLGIDYYVINNAAEKFQGECPKLKDLDFFLDFRTNVMYYRGPNLLVNGVIGEPIKSYLDKIAKQHRVIFEDATIDEVKLLVEAADLEEAEWRAADLEAEELEAAALAEAPKRFKVIYTDKTKIKPGINYYIIENAPRELIELMESRGKKNLDLSAPDMELDAILPALDLRLYSQAKTVVVQAKNALVNGVVNELLLQKLESLAESYGATIEEIPL